MEPPLDLHLKLIALFSDLEVDPDQGVEEAILEEEEVIPGAKEVTLEAEVGVGIEKAEEGKCKCIPIFFLP